ncbi:MAG: hypothetical protein RLZZ271_557 [Pseudomonadota bacterium]|jgi:toluene monooxygenase electron transfer component
MSHASIVNEPDGSRFDASAGDTLLRAALRAGLGMSYECNSGGCGSCKFELLEGQIESLWDSAPGLTERDQRKGKHLACQCRAVGDLRIKASFATEYVPLKRPQRLRARLIGQHDLTHDIREFRFAAPGAADFLAGQYAMLDLPGVTGSRAYSMSNIGNAQGEWHFQIRRVSKGQGTACLFEQLKPGDEIGLDGPYGIAHLRAEAPRDIVCVGGGSGLAPMISIARGAAAAGMLGKQRLHFFYGARTPRDVCGQALLLELGDAAKHIEYIPVVSEPTPDWNGKTGFVHQALSHVLSQPLNTCEFYFAGPPPMTQALQEMLMVEHRVPFQQIHFDRFF